MTHKGIYIGLDIIHAEIYLNLLTRLECGQTCEHINVNVQNIIWRSAIF